jgi:putative membrane protein
MFTTKKFLYPLLFSLFVAAFFTATQPLKPEMAVVSSLFVVLFALPSYYAVISQNKWKRGAAILFAISVFALVIETSAIHTGFPYGNFIYNDLLGQKVLGLTPWTVAFAWPPILLLSYWFARLRHQAKHKLKILFSTALGAMLIDVVLDPAAVKLGFWNWRDPGFFYEVPLVNFGGWLLSGFVGAVILHRLWGKKPPTALIAYSGMIILWFWTWINVFQAHVIPSVVGFALLYICFRRITIKEV